MKLVIDNYRPPSGNLWYSGKGGWRGRKNAADEVHAIVMSEIRRQLEGVEPFDGPVDIQVVVFFDKYPFDSSNVPGKLIEDGVVKAGVLKDDNRKYVRWVCTRSEIDRDNPRVEITLTPVEAERKSA